MSKARILEQVQHLVSGKLRVTEHIFEVLKDHRNPAGGTIQLFGRSVVKHEKPAAKAPDEERKAGQLPWLVYLQGGPGFGCSAPQNSPLTDVALGRGYQVLFLDQRGTGLSSPITAQTLSLQGDISQQADYLMLFRADSIVQDCEAVRRTLTDDYPEHLKKWSVFGQSFGGFCILTYLSNCPQGLREAFTTGGLPPIGKTPDEVYQATFKKVMERNKAYYEKFPEDVDTIQRLVYHIKSTGGVRLPSGGLLTVRNFLTLGRAFGFHGGLDTVHDLVLRMRTDLSQFGFITRPTLSALESALSFDDAIIYAILHEAIYCERTASNWAAERVSKSLREYQWLSDSPQSLASVKESPLFFTGEMIFPFMFDVSAELEKLKPVADIIAKYKEWPELYNEWQLARNEVPIYCATYIDDMYVDYGLSQDTAALVKNCKQFITNVMYHNALKAKTEDVLKGLFALRDDELD